jgi:hypothetical protein
MDNINLLIEKLMSDKEDYEKDLTDCKEKFNTFLNNAKAYQILDLNFYSDEYKKLLYISKQISEIEIKIRTLRAVL